MPDRPSPVAPPAPGARPSLREPGAILLVSCYELGHQPLGLAFPCAFLARAGFAPAAADLAIGPLPAEAVRRARLVAVSVPMHTALRIGIAAARRVRELNPDAIIAFYGSYAQLNRAHLLAGIGDVVLGGEAEAALVTVAESVERGGDPRAAGGIGLTRLDFPVPARDALPPLERYATCEIAGERRLAGAVEASRGCLHLCRHCPIPPVYGGRFFVVPPDVVLADIRWLVAHGARHITFADPDFLNGPRHAVRIAEALHDQHPTLTFDFTAKVEHLRRHRDLLPRFARAGCAFIVTAAESLSDRVLEALDKGHTRADLEAVLRAVRAEGMTLRPSWLPFTPWTSLDDYLEMLEWLAVEDLVACVEPVQLSIRLLVPPGSLLLDRPDLRPHLRGLDAERLSWRWAHPDARMERLHATVSEIVHRANHSGEDVVTTFERVRVAARALARGSLRPAAALATHAERRPVPPRLTEPWFC